LLWTISKVFISVIVITAVSVVAKASPKLGAVLLTLPVISLIAFCLTWMEQRDLKVVSQLARETLVLVPLGLPFFVPLAFAERFRLGFWTAFLSGILLATCCIGIWLKFGPKNI
jgi:hypothetical protein